MKVLQKKKKGCNESFFYNGVIAETSTHIAVACGEIRIAVNGWGVMVWSTDDGVEYADGVNPVVDDEDLKYRFKPEDWQYNNWFEIYSNAEDPTPFNAEVLHEYDDVIDRLNEIEREVIV